jgi:iron complex transport system ATP-binding protein
MTLQAQGVGKQAGGRTVLADVTLSLDSGRLTGLLGPNGAGKSTLARLLAGIDAPDAGAVLLDGAPVRDLDARRRARRIAYLPQGAPPPWPISVAELVSLARLPHGAGPDRLGDVGLAAVARALQRTGADALAHRTMDALSHGERARVGLARALAVEAEVLIADEPAASLDPAHALGALDLLVEEARRGVAVLVVLHDLSLAARVCDRVAVLSAGALVAFGPPAEALSDPVLAAVFGVEARRFETPDGALLAPWRKVRRDSA